MNRVKLQKIISILLILNLVLSLFTMRVLAQAQTFNASANDPSAYQCFDSSGNLITIPGTRDPLTPPANVPPDENGNFYCNTANGKVRAVPRPSTLQELEVIFVKVLYAIWALAAALSFVFLIGVGYDYLIRGGTSDQELVKLRKRILNFIGGFVLIFLAVPILSTVFRLLGINDSVQCYRVNMPGFQFFYSTLCTDPNNVTAKQIINDPCNAGLKDPQEIVGKLCNKSYIGKQSSCAIGPVNVTFLCKDLNGQNGAWCISLKAGVFQVGCSP